MRIRRSSLIALLVLETIGCSTHIETVKYQPTELTSSSASGQVPVVIGTFVDDRGTNANWLGAIRGGYGNPLKKLYTDRPVSEVVEQADCGILLDVNNIYVSSQNHNFDPYDYLNNVPHHRVGQIHIAGHSKFEKYILDTHDHPVLDPVWKMYAHATKLTGPTATLLEWDDRIPSFDEVHREALKAGKFCKDLLNEPVAA